MTTPDIFVFVIGVTFFSIVWILVYQKARDIPKYLRAMIQDECRQACRTVVKDEITTEWKRAVQLAESQKQKPEDG
jgi:CHASE3 domain sensor protein